MDRKIFFEDINSVINDWKNTTFTFYDKNYVPGLDDTNLTYGNGEEKKGIVINTCVLFVDIRNSVQLTKDKQIRTMGKIYSVFIHCILLAAQQEGGYVRNIIGDRVMVVFPPENCYTKAVECAITINHITGLINGKFNNFEFKCGIGVDYGSISVMKVGVVRKGAENDDNKGLVWAGYPANFASRLTDCANKEFTDVVYAVDADFYEYNMFVGNLFLGRPSGWYRNTQELTAEKFAESISVNLNGQMISSSFKNPRSIKKVEKKFSYKPIILSNKVFQEYKKANSSENSIVNGWWHRQTRKIRDIDFDVFGSDIHWVFN